MFSRPGLDRATHHEVTNAGVESLARPARSVPVSTYLEQGHGAIVMPEATRGQHFIAICIRHVLSEISLKVREYDLYGHVNHQG